MIKVSVIVPVYNVEKYIEKCLKSLVNQTLEDIEIIVVNDGSPDNSQEIIDKYAKQYPEKIKSYIKKNGGQGSARNYGIKKSSGEFIAFVDSDDFIDVTMLEKLYNKAITSNLDIVVCNAYRVFEEQKEVMNTFVNYSKDNSKNYILNCSGPCFQLIKRNIFIENDISFLEQRFYEDIAIIPSLCVFANKIEYIDEPLYYYLIRKGSTMNQIKYSTSFLDIFNSMSNLSSIFKRKNCYKKYYEELEFIYIEHLLHASSLRFLKFKKYEELNSIIDIMKKEFPNWRENIYYKKMNLKYKIVCYFLYNKKYKILNYMLKG